MDTPCLASWVSHGVSISMMTFVILNSGPRVTSIFVLQRAMWNYFEPCYIGNGHNWSNLKRLVTARPTFDIMYGEVCFTGYQVNRLTLHFRWSSSSKEVIDICPLNMMTYHSTLSIFSRNSFVIHWNRHPMSRLTSKPQGAHVHFDICDFTSGQCCDNYFFYLARNV